MLQRLQKIIAQAGVASRRAAEEMITEGKVIVNGQIVTRLGTKVDIQNDKIRGNGKEEFKVGSNTGVVRFFYYRFCRCSWNFNQLRTTGF